MAAKTIFVIEDDQSIREALKLFLEMEGYGVFTAADGKQALDSLITSPQPCLILLDLMMPVMNGYEFLKARKGYSNVSEVPVVVVSAFLEPSQNLDVQGFVRKPIDLNQLLSLVKQYCC